MSKKDNQIEVEILKVPSTTSKKVNSVSDIKRDIKRQKDHVKKVNSAISAKAEKLRNERAEISRKVSLANKRLKRLEEKGYTDNPAYVKSGGYFSIKGKNYNQTQKELARLDKFINATTSTIRGTHTYLKEMATNTGIKYKNLQDLRVIAPKFFELASKTEQYLRTVEDMASAIDYNQIWEQVNVYVTENRIDLTNAKGDIDQMIKHVVAGIKQYEDKNTVQGVTFRLKK